MKKRLILGVFLIFLIVKLIIENSKKLMFQKLKIKKKIKNEFFLLILIILITAISTGYHNYSKKKIA